MSQPYKYFAFISYSRKDSKVAAWLQKRLEWFRFPVKFVPADRRPPHDRYVRPIYRDKTNLEVTDEHYWQNIRRALEESRFLIILCSPHSAKSEPVNMEVEHFLKTHGGDAGLMVPVIVSGNVTSTGEDTALCPALGALGDTLITRNLPTMVPDAVTAERDAWEAGFVSLVSYLLRLERTALGDHIQRETQRQARVLRRWLAAVIVLAVISITAGAVAYKQKQAADAQKLEAQAQTLRAINAEKATQAQLAETNRQLDLSHISMGGAWLERGRAAYNKGDHLGALMHAGRAVGFKGYGRRAEESYGFTEAFPLLLGRVMSDPRTEKSRQAWLEELTEFIDSVRPTHMPLWGGTEWGEEVTCLVFSPDGSRFASGSDGSDNKGMINLWDAATGKRMNSFVAHTKFVMSLSFSPDGCRLASGSGDKTIKVWDVTTGKELHSLAGHKETVTCVVFNPDGNRLASSSRDHTIKLWDTATGKELTSLIGHRGMVTSVVFNPDGSRLASGSDDHTIKIWNAATGKEQTSILGHMEPVNSVAFSPEGSRLATCSGKFGGKGEIKLWDAATSRELASLDGHRTDVSSVVFSPDGHQLASRLGDHTIKLWDVATTKQLPCHIGSENNVAFSPDGSRLAGASKFPSNMIRLWDMAVGGEIAHLGGHKERVTNVVFSLDGNRLATSSDDQTIGLWDSVTGKNIAFLAGHKERVTSVDFSPDGKRLASSSRDKTIKLWDTSTGKELATLDGHWFDVRCVVFSPDGNYLASGSDDKSITLWDAATGKRIKGLGGHGRGLNSVAFSPDGRCLASADDHMVKLWDVTSGKEIASFTGLAVAVSSVAFSPDGSRLASYASESNLQLGSTTEIKCWDVVTGNSSPLDAAGRASARLWFAAQEHRLSPDQQTIARADGRRVYIVPTKRGLDLTAPLRAGLVSEDSLNLTFPAIRGTTPMLHVRQDTLAQLADPKLTPERYAELRMELCTKSSQFRAATALWQRLLQGEWPGFEGATVPKDQAPATIPADSPIRRLYLLALIDATKHPQIHGHPTICQTALQIAPVLTKEMMATPTISLAMMSLMQTLAKDTSPDMSAPRAALLKRLEEVAKKEWLEVLRESAAK